MSRDRLPSFRSLGEEFVTQLVDEFGEPDFTLDSAESAMRGLPDLDSDPAAAKAMRRLRAATQNGDE